MTARSGADISLYINKRIAFFKEKLNERIAPGDTEKQKQKENYRKALELYENGELPGPKGIYHFTYIQDGKVCDIEDLHPFSPHWLEVRIAEVLWSCPFLTN